MAAVVPLWCSHFLPFHAAPVSVAVYHFVAAVPVAIAVVALVARELRAPPLLRGAALAVLAWALFYLHISALAIALGAAGLLAITARKPLARMLRALA